MAIDTTITFLMGLLNGAGEDLHSLTDHKYIAEIPNTDMVLNGAHKTVVGVTILGSTRTSYFMSTIREYLKSDVSAQITVLSAFGSNDSHCRRVISGILDVLQDAQYIGTYRIFINSAKWEIKVDGSPQKWVGNITLDITRFDPI